MTTKFVSMIVIFYDVIGVMIANSALSSHLSMGIKQQFGTHIIYISYEQTIERDYWEIPGNSEWVYRTMHTQIGANLANQQMFWSYEISTNAVGCMFAKIRIDVTSNCLAKLEGYRLRIHHSQLASQLLMSWNDEFLMNHHCVGFYSEYRRTMVVISDSFVVVFVYKEANKQPHLRMVQVDVQRSRQTSKTSPSAYGSAHGIRARTNSKYKTRFLRT